MSDAEIKESLAHNRTRRNIKPVNYANMEIEDDNKTGENATDTRSKVYAKFPSDTKTQNVCILL